MDQGTLFELILVISFDMFSLLRQTALALYECFFSLFLLQTQTVVVCLCQSAQSTDSLYKCCLATAGGLFVWGAVVKDVKGFFRKTVL